MHAFADLTAVEEVLEELMGRTPPLVARLPRQPGRKECRYAHLFAGQPEIADEEMAAPPEAARLRVMAENERLARVEEELATLRAEVGELRRLVEEFKAQFE